MKIFSLLAILWISTGYAVDLQTFNHRTFSFANEHCVSGENCELKKLTVKINDYRIRVAGNYSYGSKAFTFYQTDKVQNLEKFAIVQFIRGCLFSSKLNSDGSISYDFPYHIRSFDEYIPFKFAQWSVDSLDKDPMYSSWDQDDLHTRHYYYMWNEVPWSTSKKTRHNFGGPTVINFPLLYVKDLPGQATLQDGVAYNTSLQFKTCIYRTEDIPRVTERDDVNFATPIHCIEWSSSFIYNHKRKKFESHKNISPICIQ